MKTQLSATLENARNYTLEVAAAMPAEHYHFRPSGEIWTFAALLHHIAYGIGWWEENYIRQQASDWHPPEVNPDKQAVTAYLEKAFAGLKQTIGSFTPDEKQIAGFHATLDHITHHRGQATVYLRCKGIVPPAYVY